MQFKKMMSMLALAGGLVGPGVSDAEALRAYGVSWDMLLTLGPGYNLQQSPPVRVSNLQSGEELYGIDYNAVDGKVYVVTSQNRILTVVPETGAATQVGWDPFADAASHVVMAFEIIPGTNEARVVTESNANLRVSLTSGEVVSSETTLTYSEGDVNEANWPYIQGIAYSADNTLYGFDETMDTLVRVGGPAGAPSGAGGSISTLGAFGAEWEALENESWPWGYFLSRDGMDVGPDGTIYVIKATSFENLFNFASIFSVDPATGAATKVHDHDTHQYRVRSFTVVPDVPDTDGDGVLDPFDQCPDTAAGHPVDAVGCPLDIGDADGDGVVNWQDQCPDTAPNMQVNSNGCPIIDVEVVLISNSQKCSKSGACKRKVEIRVLKSPAVTNTYVTVDVYESPSEFAQVDSPLVASKKVKFNKKTNTGKLKLNAKMVNGNSNLLVYADGGNYEVKGEENEANNKVVAPRP